MSYEGINGDLAFPLTYGQKSMWLMHEALPDSPAYNVAICVRLGGRLHVPDLRRALEILVERHDALRAVCFAAPDGELLQAVSPGRALSFEQIDISGWTESLLAERVTAAYRRPFDLASGPLLRCSLFLDGDGRNVLLANFHHIVVDGPSVFTLLTELQQTYDALAAGEQPALRPLRSSYRDFVEWQSGFMGGAEGQQQLQYWLEALKGAPQILDLPTDHTRAPQLSARGGSLVFALESPLVENLKRVARDHGAHLYDVLLAAYQTLLYRYSGQRDFLIGFLTSGRTQLRFAKVCGLFINPVVLRAQPSPETSFADFLRRQREGLAEALARQDYPFAAIAEHLRIARTPGYMPLVQVLFNFFKVPRTAGFDELFVTGHPTEPVSSAGGLEMQSFGLHQDDGEFDLSLEVAEGRRLWCRFKYRADLFAEGSIERLARHYRNLLEAVAQDPQRGLAELPLLDESERQQILVDWNQTDAEYPRDTCVHSLFEEQAARTPEAVALVFEGRRVTYDELNRLSNSLARELTDRGARPGVLVGICLERSIEMVVGLLGILKAGAAYVPLDPHFPKPRLDMIVEDAAPAILLTQQSLLSLAADPSSAFLIDAQSDLRAAGRSENPPSRAGGDDLAYVLYTSGSTGRPKGVQIPHSAFTNFLLSMRERPGLTAADTLLAVTTISFDIAGLELFLPLICGATVVIAGRDRADGERLAEALSSHGATVMQATPATWRLLIDSGWKGTPGLKALCGGEMLPRDLAGDLLSRVRELWNMYGPTETTVWSSACRVEPGEEPIPIGAPIANTTLYVLDDRLQPVPPGVTGELFIGGSGVARGYLNRSELTNARFLSDPFRPGERIYKTGDAARYRGNGEIVLLGRLDDQVKLRGHRIELADIESTLLRHPAVREAAVILVDDPPGNKRLVAYLSAREGAAPPDPRVLRDHVSSQLPDYMVPAAFVLLDALPLTPNNKLDRNALKSVAIPAHERTASAMPQSPAEIAVAKVWSDVLGIEGIGREDRFDELGGDSLSFARMMMRVRAVCGSELPVTMESGLTTVAAIAAAVGRQQPKAAAPAPEVAPPSPGRAVTLVPQSARQRKLLVGAGRLLLGLVARVEYNGLENVPGSGPFIIAGNHISFFDSFIYGSSFGGHPQTSSFTPAFIIADKWRRWVHWYAKRFGHPIYIRRGHGDLDSLDEAAAVLRANGVVAIMPEGRPTRRGGLIPSKPGIAYLAAQAGAPVLPIALHGHELAFESWRRFRRVRVRIAVGPVVRLGETAVTHADHRRETDRVMRAIARMLPPELRGHYADCDARSSAA